MITFVKPDGDHTHASSVPTPPCDPALLRGALLEMHEVGKGFRSALNR